jgi:hypothetical protein
VSSDKEDDDEDWRATWGGSDDGRSSKEYIEQQRQSELERFMNDALDVSITRVVHGKRVTMNMKDEPLRWWRERGQQLYPTLATVAFNLFSIPGMSSECERSFSDAGNLITDYRYNLKNDIIQADQCLKSWFKNNVADGQAALTNIAAAALDEDDEIVDIAGL